MTRPHWLLSLSLLLFTVLFLLVYHERLSTWLSGEKVIAVRVVPVTTRVVPMTVRINGMLAPVKAVNVVSQLPGRITEVRFKVGDAVPAGAVVATVFPTEIAQREIDLRAGLGAARAELQTKESQLADAEKVATRTRELFAQDLIARRDMENAESAAQTARAQVELARAHLAQQQAMLGQAQKISQMRQLTAPISGVIARRFADPGATIAPGSTILSIAGDSNLKFTGRVAGEFADKLRVGLYAQVSTAALPETKIDGSLTSLEPRRDNGATVVEVEIQINDGPPTFRAAAAADALVRLDQNEEIFLLPRSAVGESGRGNYLFKFAEGHAVRQEVELGSAEGADVVIRRGISRTDLVILDNLGSLKPGAKVRASIVAPPPAR